MLDLFRPVAAVALALSAATASASSPVPERFTYQGELVLNGQPVDGNADFIFLIYDGNTMIASDMVSNVPVSEGLFAAQVAIPAENFDGTDYDLEIQARSPAGSGSFTTLTPRQALSTTPYAYHSNSADTLLAPATITEGASAGFFNNIIPRTVTVESVSDIGIAATGVRFGIAGLIDDSDPFGGAGVLGQSFGFSNLNSGVRALNAFGTRADLATASFAGQFIGDVEILGNQITEGSASFTGPISQSYSNGAFDLAAPVAYGYINNDGSPGFGTPNISSVYNSSAGRYEITIDNESYFFNRYVTVVTSIDPNQVADTGSSVGRLLITLRDGATGNTEQGRFTFVVYRPAGSAAIAGRNRPALQPLDPRIPTDAEVYNQNAGEQPRQITESQQPTAETTQQPAGAQR